MIPLIHIGIAVVVACLALFATCTPTPSTLGDITLLINNDLLGPDSPNADSGVLVLRNRTFGQATTDCQSLGEQLWAPELHTSSVLPNLNFLEESGTFPAGQRFWIASDRAINANGSIEDVGAAMELPALCTQSAPFSNESFQDASQQWQISLKSNNQFLTGFRDRVSFRFQGIRYAPQPERFTYPTLFNGSGENASATAFGSECVQSPGVGSEDCLFLNIWTPFLPANGSSTPTQNLKPVMFQIHGGAFTSGTGNDPTFDGGGMVSRGDVVMVAINYRLGTLGFLALEDGVTNGNFGLADQITALDWVRANIRDFGGDPDRITIFGQSAGAGSVRALMASPKAIGKFAGAIPQSNLAGLNFASTYSHYFTIAQDVAGSVSQVLAATNCSNATSQVDCLRAVPANTLATLSVGQASFPVVDGTILTSAQLPLDKSGPIANVHLLMGFMRDDGAPFIGFPTTADVPTAIAEAGFNSSLASTGAFPPPPASGNATLDAFNVTARITTDAEFRCLDYATVFAAVANNLLQPNVFVYEFNRSYQTPGFDPNAPTCDAPATPAHPFGDPSLEYFKCHSGELFYVFGTLLRQGLRLRDDGDLPFMQFVLDQWASFARTFDPNPDAAFLSARGFANTSAMAAAFGRWAPLDTAAPSFRNFMLPTRQVPFSEATQCDTLGFPLDFYVNGGQAP